MKKPEYTAGVVSVYRKYLDFYLEHGRDGFLVSEVDKKILNDLYNRGGFTKGYYIEKNGKDMMFFQGKEKEAENGVRNQELLQAVRDNFLSVEPKEAISGTVVVRCGEKASLTVTLQKKSVTVLGEEAVLAQKQPMTQEKIAKQIEKTGGTPFYFSHLSVETDGNSFISITALNELRRKALEQITSLYLEPFYRKEEKVFAQERQQIKAENKNNEKSNKIPFYQINVYLEKKEYVKAVAAFSEVSSIYLDASEFSAEDIGRYKKQFPEKRFYYMLPHIFRDTAKRWFEQEYQHLLQAGVDGFSIRNLDELSFFIKKAERIPVRFDFTLYGFNSESMRVFEEEWQAELITLPLELNGKELAQIADKKSELIVYGYLPMMVSAQCTRKSRKGCDHQSDILTLIDRYNNEFIVKNRCKFCYNRIYNCKPLSLLSMKQKVDQIAPYAIRLDFTWESVTEVTEILSKFIQAYREELFFSEEPFAFTRGHLKRGIE